MSSAVKARRATTSYRNPDPCGYPVNYDPGALEELHERGGRFVRLAGRVDDPSHDPEKRPIKGERFKNSTLAKDHLLAHVMDGGLVGVVPPSLRLAVLDIDRGDPERVKVDFPPLLATPTRRRGGAHLWYDHPSPSHSPNWQWDSAGGETRAGSGGYVVLWNRADSLLADALDGPDRGMPFSDVLEQMGLWAPGELDRLAPRQRKPVDLGAIEATLRIAQAPVDGVVVAGRGHRNQTILGSLLRAAGRDPSLRTNPEGMAALAAALNARCEPPLPASELGRIVRNAVEYAAGWADVGHTPDFVDRQRVRGRRSGEKRRAATTERRAAIVAARDQGFTNREIAEFHGVSKSTVIRVLRGLPHPTPRGIGS